MCFSSLVLSRRTKILKKSATNLKKCPQQAHPPSGWLGPGRNSPNMKASCPLELPPKLLRGARMRPSNRGSILDICFLFGSLTACQNLKKTSKKPQIRPSAAPPTPHPPQPPSSPHPSLLSP